MAGPYTPRGLRDYELDDLTSYELIDILDKLFPRILPIPSTDTMEHIWYKAGERALIELLLQKKERELNERRNSKVTV